MVPGSQSQEELRGSGCNKMSRRIGLIFSLSDQFTYLGKLSVTYRYASYSCFFLSHVFSRGGEEGFVKNKRRSPEFWAVENKDSAHQSFQPEDLQREGRIPEPSTGKRAQLYKGNVQPLRPVPVLCLCENWSTSFSQDGEGLYTHSSDKEVVKTVAVPGACWENFAF